MDIKDLVEDIKKEGYSKPQIGLITPEIRTIDVVCKEAVNFIEEEEE